ncbi:MAG: four helix bundle protein [Parcubacteria group bacterium]|jgi:four helix bundle protein
METKKYIKVQDLELYKLARELSMIAWDTYEKLSWQDKKIMGDQFVRATDSFGANIVEGYNRYHFLDKIKFLYISRASLAEANDYWIELLLERKKITAEKYKEYKETSNKASIKLQNFISSIYRAKRDTC